MSTHGPGQAYGLATDAHSALRGHVRKRTGAGAATPDTFFGSRTCVALLAAFLMLPAGQASTENYVPESGDCGVASLDGGIVPAAAAAQVTVFNAVFGRNSMARGETASPSSFR
jgi:hypothetical protein